MKKIFAWMLILVMLMTFTACGSDGGYDTPEEAATNFVKAHFENNLELFKSCVHPETYDYMVDRFDMLDGEICIVNDMRVINVEYMDPKNNPDEWEDILKSLKERLIEDKIFKKNGKTIDFDSVCIVEIWVSYIETDDRSGKEQTLVYEAGLMCVDDRWYVIMRN